MKTIITLDGIVMTERDSLGRETEKTGLNTDVTEEITYDAFGRISERESGGISQSYTYDANSNLTGYSLKEGSLPLKTESYTYDNLNRITGITDNGTLTAYSYDLNGRLTQKSVTGGITASYAYNDGGYLTNITYPGKSFSASYHLNGMKSSENINGVIKNYSYDSQGRLTGVTGAEGSLEAYTYDINGNRISKAENGASYSYSYDGNNRLIEETKNPNQLNEETKSFTYDNNGNLIKETASGDSGLLLPLPGENEKNYEYNSLGQLVSFTDGEADAEYEYFYDGLRANKSVNNSETEYIWNGSNLAYETNQSGNYIYGYDMTGIVSADISGIKNYYIKDIHGNISATVSSGGVESESMTYSSFGEMSGNDFPLTPFGYCGEYLDSESGLIYLRNRYYDPSIGRFITEDPARDGLNWYVYCGNNPVNFVDPLGLWEDGDEDYPDFIQDAIRIYTEAWEYAYRIDDAEGMKNAHSNAESARALGNSFIARGEWGAIGVGDKFGADPDKHTIVIHHTVGIKSIKTIEKEHIDEGFGTVGYHFVIGSDGTVYEGTPLENKGAHVALNNTGLIGISLIGNFEPSLFRNNTPEQPQLLSMIRLVQILKDGQCIYSVKGHRDYNGVVEGTKDTVCPGQNLYDITDILY